MVETLIPPYTVRVLVYKVPRLNVTCPSRPITLKLAHVAADPNVTVQLPVPTFEFTSKYTSSEGVGAVAPPAPPELADQFVVAVKLHVPLPSTQ